MGTVGSHVWLCAWVCLSSTHCFPVMSFFPVISCTSLHLSLIAGRHRSAPGLRHSSSCLKLNHSGTGQAVISTVLYQQKKCCLVISEAIFYPPSMTAPYNLWMCATWNTELSRWSNKNIQTWEKRLLLCRASFQSSIFLRFLSFLHASVHCGAYTENRNGFDSSQLGRKRADWYLGKTKLYLRNFLTLKFAARRRNMGE